MGRKGSGPGESARTTPKCQRRAVIGLRDRGEISDEVLHEVERELDIEAIRIGKGEQSAPDPVPDPLAAMRRPARR
jgi:hypothetical protein